MPNVRKWPENLIQCCASVISEATNSDQYRINLTAPAVVTPAYNIHKSPNSSCVTAERQCLQISAFLLIT